MSSPFSLMMSVSSLRESSVSKMENLPSSPGTTAERASPCRRSSRAQMLWNVPRATCDSEMKRQAERER